jgi:cytochrome c-type biogenesis protein CcsB
MISYWVQIAFHAKKWNIGKISMFLANFCLLSLLILRWKESGHFPLSNLYESLMFLAWSLSTFHLILENIESGTNKNGAFFKNSGQQSGEPQKGSNRFFVGAFTSPTALFINAFATFRLPLEMQQSSPLVPALQSNWLMMHVTVMILSYSALICGSLLSIAFLIVTKNLQFDFNNEKSSENESIQGSSQTAFLKQKSDLLPFPERAGVDSSSGQSPSGATLAFSIDSQRAEESFALNIQNSSGNTSMNKAFSFMAPQMQMKQKFAENLDNLSYRILGIGFPLLTIGILSGAVWANEAWGSYWSWDPKETWALATWLVFAIYLHLRISKGWRGKKPAILASLGFVTVWVCFLGVNLLGEGLHSYGFLKDSF